MKKIFAALFFLGSFLPAFASHIAGGELYYEYIGDGALANTSRYMLTMRLFRDCRSIGQTLATERVVIGIYSTNQMKLYSTANLNLQTPIPSINLNTNAIPCLVNAPEVCFQIGVFTGTVDLPKSQDGYTLTWVRCCRIDNIGNLDIGNGIGGTFVTKIPGTATLPNGHNSSPQFAIKDTALVCQRKNFVLDFGATDADGDVLTYAFCDAYLGGSSGNPNPGTSQAGLPQSLSLFPLPYASPYSGESPLGTSVSINPATGKITGVAPVAGRYVINVCITEWRNGVAINEHRKDFILQVGDCDYAAALPVPISGAYCADFKVNFSNNSTSSAINEYHWDFGVTESSADTSNVAEPIFTYPDTGLYKVRLIVKAAAGCVDTGITTLGVYPGFKPDFDISGSCFQAPFSFIDRTIANYGVVNAWSWNFGDANTFADTSNIKNPSYKYADTGRRSVLLTVTSSKGCKANITKVVSVTNKPALNLPFKDTLICSIDTLLLKAEGTGAFTWSPAYNILNANTANPQVYPKSTSIYTVTLTDKGCVASDTIRVNVLDSVQVFAGADTSICATDSIVFKPVSRGLQFHWDPVAQIPGNADVKNASARPSTTTTFVVTARLGKCTIKDDIRVIVAPYPGVYAGPDVSICYGQQTRFMATTASPFFRWNPVDGLTNESTLNPIATPLKTTRYVLTVNDTLGCPKAVSDTMVVTVVPRINAFAGNDTTVVANQPLQLNASGGFLYTWSPTVGLNNPSVANPVVLLNASHDSVTYKVRVEKDGCFADDDIKVIVFKTAPDIFTPSAFTPNGDGRNDYLKPIAVGMKSVNTFKVFNRWGQVIFNSTVIGRGWDGKFGGKEQSPGTYVYFAEGTDYLGKSIFKKGTVVLIR